MEEPRSDGQFLNLDHKRNLLGPPIVPHQFMQAGQDDTSCQSDDLAATIRACEVRLSALLEDRSRLARDLHDIVLQSLYAIGLSIETARRQHRNRSVGVRRADGLVVDQLNQLIHRTRMMIQELESGTIEEFDLATELEALIATYRRIGPIRIDLQIVPELDLFLTREEKEDVLNIAREALSNCVRHANATHAGLFLTRQGSSVRLRVCDNGVGFTSTGMPTNRIRRGGYGLANMAARAKRLGGRCSILPRPGGGTEVLVEFTPLPELVTS